MMEANRICSICDRKTKFLGIHPDFGVDINYCGSCDFAHISLISEAMLTDYYRDTYTLQSKRNIFGESYQNIQLTRARHQVEFIQTVVDLHAVQTVLDVGCGIGMSALALQEANPDLRWFGIEPDKKCQDILVERGLKIAENFQDTVITYDIIYSSHSLEHFAQPDKFFERVQRSANSHGYLFLEVPNESSFMVRKIIEAKRKGRAHISFYSRKSLMLVANKHGWDCLKFEYCAANDRYSMYSYFRPESLWIRVLDRLRLLRWYWRVRDELLRIIFPQSGVAMRAIFVRD